MFTLFGTLQASAMEVPFWYETDPITGEEKYVDYFEASSYIMKEYKAYIITSETEVEETSVADQVPEEEQPVLIEETIYEYKNIKIRDSQFDHGPFANPDHLVKELVAVTIFVPDTHCDFKHENHSIGKINHTEYILSHHDKMKEMYSDCEWFLDLFPVHETIDEDIPEIEISILLTQNVKAPTPEDVLPIVIDPLDVLMNQDLKNYKLQFAEDRASDLMNTWYPGLYN